MVIIACDLSGLSDKTMSDMIAHYIIINVYKAGFERRKYPESPRGSTLPTQGLETRTNKKSVTFYPVSVVSMFFNMNIFQ